jgi:glycosyltransferase involved in cell wall biosynthesis
MTGRLVELFTDSVPTVCMSLYLSPHTLAVSEALRVARSTGLPVSVATVAEAVGSDVTNVVRSCAGDGRFGAAAQVLSAYLDSDVPVAVSDYTKELIISSAEEIDARHGTSFAERCRQRVAISYPAINTADYLHISPERTAEVLSRRRLLRDGYVLYLSRLARAKGVDDLIGGFATSAACQDLTLVIAGNGPEAPHLREFAAASSAADRIRFLDDVDDDEKPHLMAGCAAFVLPSKPRPEFVETFGIALVEKMLAGGGPVITTNTGGIGEAVGDTAMIVPVGAPSAIATALDRAVTMPDDERIMMAERAGEHALQFDRTHVFDRLLERLTEATERALSPI